MFGTCYQGGTEVLFHFCGRESCFVLFSSLEAIRRKMVESKIKGKLDRRLTVLRRCVWRIWGQIFTCAVAKPSVYKMLTRASTMPAHHSASIDNFKPKLSLSASTVCPASLSDSDLVSLKITLLGDTQIGKTSFVVKYVGEEESRESMKKTKGLSSIDKTFYVDGARISYTLWEVEGGGKWHDYVPVACKGSVAIFFMFDLTSRCTLNSVVTWYKQARKYNQTAIPVLIGTKFDEFISLPNDLQWTIASQARSYAKAFNATLFFSSASYNINVNKIFKFITAKLFDLPFTVERNLTIGEPIIDF